MKSRKKTIIIISTVFVISTTMFLIYKNISQQNSFLGIIISITNLLFIGVLIYYIIYEKKETLFRNVFDNIENGVAIYDVSENGTRFKFKDFNKASEKIENIKKEDVIGKEIREVFSDVEKTGLLNVFNKVYKTGVPVNYPAFEYRNNRLIGWRENYVFKLKTGEIVVLYKDITEKKRTEQKIEYLLFHDKLTGVYNRRFFEVEIKRLDTNRKKEVAIIMGDINGLKLTNDCFGHAVGDKLLINVANILKKVCRHEDIIARWGGDEFVVILIDANKQIVNDICKRIEDACAKADGKPVKPNIALGFAMKFTQDTSLQDVLKEAEDKMYRNKLMESNSIVSEIISSMGKTLFNKGYESPEHVKRMQLIANKIGIEIGLLEYEITELKFLCILHDIGKSSISDNIIFKKGILTASEWSEIKKHSETGYRIAKSSSKIGHIADYILAHHERWDGLGYPQGLKGDYIPKVSRIFSVIDSFDIMTSGTVYKSPITAKEAFVELQNGSGTKYDPNIVQVFIDIMKKNVT